MEEYKFPRAIAFYLPQYHPIPENDEWWGKGFTEWTNVVKAKPLFKGHHQPHLPADLGFYDLRIPEVRQAQADMARSYGINGFCYYHYWFNGKQLLERPFTEVLKSGEPDFPFCLCWANENWTRIWDGSAKQILIKQEYSLNDDQKFIEELIPAFMDKRYIRLEEKPVFLVYKASSLPDPKRTTDNWREAYLRAGLGELYLCKVESGSKEIGDPKKLGFDAAVEFQPDWSLFNNRLRSNLLWRILTKLRLSPRAYQQNVIMEYRSLMEQSLRKPIPDYKRYACVTPRWDNSSRRKSRAHILVNSSPQLFSEWITAILQSMDSGKTPNEFLFVNAWNEWGEGNHLEPDTFFGKAYLEALSAISNSVTDND